MKKTNWRSFEEARNFAQSLQIKNQKEWFAWSKSGERPDDIPSDPSKIYNKDGWNDWGDWLGTGAVASFNRTYRLFEEARAFVHQLQLKGQKEWQNWAKSKLKPDDIPSNPSLIYKDQGWKDLGDWLGTGIIAPKNRKFLSFKIARTFVHQLNLKSKQEWADWHKSELRPDNIPANPAKVYKDEGWEGLGDWLGTGRIANQNRNYLSFEEARTFVHQLQLKNQNEWKAWSRSEAKPDYIPADPAKVYKNKGWLSSGDWLGTGKIANQNRIYRPFEEARHFIRSIQLKSSVEWRLWSKTKDKPDDIPVNPPKVYKELGWIGWADWLGVVNRWDSNTILSFLYSLKPILASLDSSELYAIMRQNGMIDSISAKTKKSDILKGIKDLCSTEDQDLEAEFNKLVDHLQETTSNESSNSDEADFYDYSVDDDLNSSEEIETDLVPDEIEDTDTDLPQLKSFDSLKAVDLLVEAGITSDHETIEFLICNRVSALWQDRLNNDPTFDLERLRNETGGTYFQTIRDRFLSQHDGAANLTIPNGYIANFNLVRYSSRNE